MFFAKSFPTSNHYATGCAVKEGSAGCVSINIDAFIQYVAHAFGVRPEIVAALEAEEAAGRPGKEVAAEPKARVAQLEGEKPQLVARVTSERVQLQRSQQASERERQKLDARLQEEEAALAAKQAEVAAKQAEVDRLRELKAAMARSQRAVRV